MPSQKELKRLFNYDPETGLLTRKVPAGGKDGIKFKAGSVVAPISLDNNYKKPILTSINRKRLLLHRIIWTLVNGAIPQNKVIDHIDHDPTNNKLSNLRLVTQTENCRNMKKKKNNTSGVTGVWWSKERDCWRVEIMRNRKKIHIGDFVFLHEAKEARKQAEVIHNFHPNHGR